MIGRTWILPRDLLLPSKLGSAEQQSQETIDIKVRLHQIRERSDDGTLFLSDVKYDHLLKHLDGRIQDGADYMRLGYRSIGGGNLARIENDGGSAKCHRSSSVSRS